jgi:hypothetical protein
MSIYYSNLWFLTLSFWTFVYGNWIDLRLVMDFPDIHPWFPSNILYYIFLVIYLFDLHTSN